MTEQSEKLRRDRRDALLLALNKGLTSLMMGVFIVALLLGLARLEIARYAFWVWLMVAAIVLIAKMLTTIAIRCGWAGKGAEEPKEPSDLVAETWQGALGQRPSIVDIVKCEDKSEWRKAQVSSNRTIFYRVGK